MHGISESALGQRSYPIAPMIVQWPWDHERSPSQPFRLAQTTAMDFPQAPGHSEGFTLTSVLAVIVSLAYRYATQEDIALHLYGVVDPSSLDYRLLQVTVDGDLCLAEVAAEIDQALNPGVPTADVPSAIKLAYECNFAVLWGVGQSAAESLVVRSAYDLAVQVTPGDAATGRSATLSLFYNAALFSADSAQNLLASWMPWFSPPWRRDGRSIEALPLLSDRAMAEQARSIASSTADYPQVPVLEGIAALARAHPEQMAAQQGSAFITYRELFSKSDALALFLQKQGAGPGAYVAICVKPSFDILIGLLAVFRVGAIYVPLDPGHPQAYIQSMLEEVKPSMVLTQVQLDCFADYPVLMLPEGLEALPEAPADHKWPQVDFDQPAYIFYTSGTTGRPKGVVATHRNLAHYVHAAQSVFRFVPEDVFTSIARYTFSISFFDLLTPLSVGAQVRLLSRDEIFAPELLVGVLQQVTVVHSGPSLLSSLFRHLRAGAAEPQTFTRMRHASSGGDIVSGSVMEDMKIFFPQAEIFVFYGCTEISCMGTYFAVPRTEKISQNLVGKAFPDTTVRVVDTQLRPVPYGVVGELCFAGKGITQGYLDRPALEAQKFVYREDGQRFYRMGDMGRLLRSGDIEMLGRRDFQIQLRGMRIELAGVENTVRDLGLAAQCALVLKKDADDERLVAFVVAPKDRHIAAFRRALSLKLPDYMLPQHLVVLPHMPLTTNGKLDRHALQTLPWEDTSYANSVRVPENASEALLLEVFQRVLKRDTISTDQSFFDLGGHSLLAMVALAEIEKTSGRQLSPQLFFEDASIVALAQHLAAPNAQADQAILLNEHRGRPRLFMLSGIHCYKPLAARLEGKWAVYGVFSRSEMSLVASPAILQSVEEIARNYIEIIRRKQPSGPYALLGYSYSGIVAYEVAQQLRRSGEHVEMLVLVDAVLPEWAQPVRFRLQQLRRLWRVPVGDLMRFVWRRLQKRWSPSITGVVPRYESQSVLGQLEAQRLAINTQNAARYLAQIQPYEGRCVLIASAQRLKLDPLKSRSGGWSSYIPGLKTVTAPADHFKMMETDPDVSLVASYIEDFAKLKG